jgi:pimeloyl-ACP methyl ester carboxylesterase
VAKDCRPQWRRVNLNGRSLEVMEAGQGDPLLFLPGWGMTPRTYGAALATLSSSGLRVISPSLPGFGRSDGLGLAAGLRAHAAHIAALLDQLDPDKPCFVVGHSFGGGVALRLALDRPDLVRSLTVINTVGGAPGMGGLVPGSPLRWFRGALGELDPRDWLTHRSSWRAGTDLCRNVLRRPVQSTATGVVALTASLGQDVGKLVESGVPALFVWGDSDRLVARGTLQQLDGALHSRTVAGRHSWLLVRPQEFAEVVREALATHAASEWRDRGRTPVRVSTAPTPASASGSADRELPDNLSVLFPVEHRRRARHHRHGTAEVVTTARPDTRIRPDNQAHPFSG